MGQNRHQTRQLLRLRPRSTSSRCSVDRNRSLQKPRSGSKTCPRYQKGERLRGNGRLCHVRRNSSGNRSDLRGEKSAQRILLQLPEGRLQARKRGEGGSAHAFPMFSEKVRDLQVCQDLSRHKIRLARQPRLSGHCLVVTSAQPGGCVKPSHDERERAMLSGGGWFHPRFKPNLCNGRSSGLRGYPRRNHRLRNRRHCFRPAPAAARRRSRSRLLLLAPRAPPSSPS